MNRAVLHFAILLPASAIAQPYLPGFSPSDTLTIACPQDPGVNILTYAGWEAYQTLDDTWWGPRDPATCINLAHVTGNWVWPRIAVNEIDASRPVFIRALYDDNNVLPLTTNNQYAIGFQAFGPGSFDNGPCPGGPCSGLFAGVRIPDASGTGTAMRWYQAAYDVQDFSTYQLELCVPTEKFAENDLREFVVSLKLNGAPPGTYIDNLYSEVQDMSAWGTLVPLTSANLPQFLGSQFSYWIGWGWDNILVMHDNADYPDADHVYHLDVPPVPNVASPTNVTMYLQPFSGFNFQPYTELRGGLVLGSDSIRHPLTVVNDGADLCMGWEFIEVVWTANTSYVHQHGHISFEGRNACFQFQSGSALRVADGSTFHYGQEGRGMLLLIEGSALHVGANAELVMNGTMIIKEPAEVSEERDMHITLREGARLRFAPGSRLINDWSNGQRMKLVVTLDGGSIDVGGLSPEDRAKVVVIELPKEEWTELSVLGNPVRDQLRFSFATRSHGDLKLRCMDALGRLVMDSQERVAVGHNALEIPAHHLKPGEYILELVLGSERRTVRFVKA